MYSLPLNFNSTLVFIGDEFILKIIHSMNMVRYLSYYKSCFHSMYSFVLISCDTTMSYDTSFSFDARTFLLSLCKKASPSL